PDRRMSSVAEIKNRMLDCGALGAIMTGTGSAVFGIFPDRQSAETTKKTLSAEYKSVFLTENKHHTEI
ncbi:MAG: 4-(cytidine 5'-diphospho)-2-C-methyl-D-erythritol kinase, partial [Oscillospiraceae bacterium]|nr:4-(cytidine 5'-diphospho)-2-C-methyl-D-erythritol kinase [Oscillospiraceae bacterium]